MRRRAFLQASGLMALGHWYPRTLAAAAVARPAPGAGGEELEADVAIIGGGLGGCAAALAATRAGMRVVLAEPLDWIGGQLTSQAVPPDENRWIEEGGATASYRRMRSLVREYYRDFYPLDEAARAQAHLNPGGGRVSRLCAEPRVFLAVLEGMLAPAVASGRLTLLLGATATAADVRGDTVRAVTLRLRDGETSVLRAPVFLDATELGDLLPLVGAEFVTGGEARVQTREPGAPTAARPDNVQAFTWCLALEYRHGEDHTIDAPAGYGRWRKFVPDLTPPWTGRLLALQGSHPITLAPRAYRFDPPRAQAEETPGEGPELFRYRQIVDPRKFRAGALQRHPVTIVNWPQNDYLPGGLYGGTPADRARHEQGARELSRCLLYWLQTKAPGPDGSDGWKGLTPSGAVCGTPDGLAMAPYVRESRRMETVFTVREQHLSPESRMLETGADRSEVRATPFPDSVGIGHYRIDLHPTTGGDNYFDVECLPFQIPLGALLHVRVENLLPACKNIGTTHITNGAYRLHPVEWNVGEAAGALAAFAVAKNAPPHQVRADAELLAEFQAGLVDQGFLLAW